MKAALLLMLAFCAAASASPTCEKLTNIKGCSECRRNVCLYCDYGWGEVWAGQGANLRVTSCVKGGKCPATPFYKGCGACVPSPGNPATCIQCATQPVKYGAVVFQRQTSYLSWANNANFGRCLAAKNVNIPTEVVNNVNCLEYNPDNSCKLCKNWQNGALQWLVTPTNALFTNGVFPQSQCLTRAGVAAASLAALGRDQSRQFVPTQCVEVGTDFKCQRCQPNWAMRVLTGPLRYQCVRASSSTVNANNCLSNTPFQEYCTQCNANRVTCRTCVPGRSSVAGYCSLNCKQLFGITCATCSATACLTSDPAFPLGRR